MASWFYRLATERDAAFFLPAQIGEETGWNWLVEQNQKTDRYFTTQWTNAVRIDRPTILITSETDSAYELAVASWSLPSAARHKLYQYPARRRCRSSSVQSAPLLQSMLSAIDRQQTSEVPCLRLYDLIINRELITFEPIDSALLCCISYLMNEAWPCLRDDEYVGLYCT